MSYIYHIYYDMFWLTVCEEEASS